MTATAPDAISRHAARSLTERDRAMTAACVAGIAADESPHRWFLGLITAMLHEAIPEWTSLGVERGGPFPVVDGQALPSSGSCRDGRQLSLERRRFVIRHPPPWRSVKMLPASAGSVGGLTASRGESINGTQ